MGDETSRPRGRRRPLTRIALVFAALGALALTGCAPGSDGSTTGPSRSASDRGLDVELRQNRDQYLAHTAIIRISNTSDEAVVVTSVELAGTAFDGGTIRDRTSAVPAGQTKDLAVDLPSADCEVSESEVRAGVVLHLADTSSLVVEELPDPTNALPRIHAADCTASRVASIATVSAVPTIRLEGTGPTTVAVLTISVIPTGAPGTLELVELRSTVLLQPAPPVSGGSAAEAWPLDLVVDASSAPQTVDVRLVPTRCDPHALAEDKVGTLLPLAVRIDDGEEAVLTLPLPPGTADALKEAVRTRCA